MEYRSNVLIYKKAIIKKKGEFEVYNQTRKTEKRFLAFFLSLAMVMAFSFTSLAGTVVYAAHTQHDWDITTDEDAGTITAKNICDPVLPDTCPYKNDKYTWTLKAYDRVVSSEEGWKYDGASIDGQDVGYDSNLTVYNIQYQGVEDTKYELSETAPSQIGNYAAIMSVNTVSGKELGMPPKTVKKYFKIMADTHVHNWVLSVNPAGDAVGVKCTKENCTYETNKTYQWSIAAEAEDVTYDGEQHGAEMTPPADLPEEGLDGVTVSEISYKGIEGTSFTPTQEVPKPVKAGKYRASFSITAKGDTQQGYADFEIKKAPLTVTAKDWAITYGDKAANHGLKYEGFVNEETEERAISGTPEYDYKYPTGSREYVQGSTVADGPYKIIPSGLTAENYEITYKPGKLYVCEKPVSLEWSDTHDGETTPIDITKEVAWIYDGKVHELTATVTDDSYARDDHNDRFDADIKVTGYESKGLTDGVIVTNKEKNSNAMTKSKNYVAEAKELNNTNYSVFDNLCEIKRAEIAQEEGAGIEVPDPKLGETTFFDWYIDQKPVELAWTPYKYNGESEPTDADKEEWYKTKTPENSDSGDGQQGDQQGDDPQSEIIVRDQVGYTAYMHVARAVVTNAVEGETPKVVEYVDPDDVEDTTTYSTARNVSLGNYEPEKYYITRAASLDNPNYTLMKASRGDNCETPAATTLHDWDIVKAPIKIKLAGWITYGQAVSNDTVLDMDTDKYLAEELQDDNNKDKYYEGLLGEDKPSDALDFTDLELKSEDYEQYDNVSSDTNKYTVTVTGVTSKNYYQVDDASGVGPLTVYPKPVELKWFEEDGTTEIGDKLPVYIYDGKPHKVLAKVANVEPIEPVEGREPDVVNVTEYLGNGMKDSNAKSGTEVYTATATKLDNPNYSLLENPKKAATLKEGDEGYDKKDTPVKTVSQDYKIDPLPVELKWKWGSTVYNGYEQKNTATITNKVKGDNPKLTYKNPSNPVAKDVGSYTTEATAVDDKNYTMEEGKNLIQKDWKITQAPLTVVAKNKTIYYKDKPANNGVSYVKFLGKDDESVLSGKVTFKYTYQKNGKPGKYKIIPSGNLTAKNYKIVAYKQGKLTVKDKITRIMAKIIAKGSNKGKLSWNKVTGAKKYLVYHSPCDKNEKKMKLKFFKTVKGKKLKIKDLKANKFYKFRVDAVTSDGTVKGNEIHFVTANLGQKQTNAKSLKVNFKKATISAGKTKKIKATVTKVKAKKKLIKKAHAPKFRYLSANKAVATVSSKGVIKGVAKGWCRIYVLTTNGIWKSIEVTVK